MRLMLEITEAGEAPLLAEAFRYADITYRETNPGSNLERGMAYRAIAYPKYNGWSFELTRTILGFSMRKLGKA